MLGLSIPVLRILEITPERVGAISAGHEFGPIIRTNAAVGLKYSMKSGLVTEQLQCVRDDRALFENLSFQFSTGEVIQVKGPNGSGKTTLLRTIVGIAEHVEGQFNWSGVFGNGSKPDPLKLLYLGHKPGVTSLSTPLENLSFYAEINDWNIPSRESLFKALEKVGLKGFEYTPAHSLSAGQNRRIALARLYLADTEKAPLWILDEPFTALDLKGVGQLESHIEAHAKAGGMVILTTHHELKISGLRVLNLEEFGA